MLLDAISVSARGVREARILLKLDSRYPRNEGW